MTSLVQGPRQYPTIESAVQPYRGTNDIIRGHYHILIYRGKIMFCRLH